MAPKRPKRPAVGHRRPCAFTSMWARRGHRKPDGECQMTRLAYGDAASGERPVYTLCDNCGRALCVDCLRRDGPGPFIGRARHHLGELLYRVQHYICQSVSTNTHDAHRLLVIFVNSVGSHTLRLGRPALGPSLPERARA